MEGLIWQPFFPTWIILVFGVISVSAVLWRGWRSASSGVVLGGVLTCIRLGAVIWVIVQLMGPSRIPEPEETDAPSTGIMMMLDSSASMLSEDMNSLSRWEFAMQNWLSPARLADLESTGPLELFLFDQEFIPTEVGSLLAEGRPPAFGEETQLIQLLEQGVRTLPEGGHLLLVTDGHDSMGLNPQSVLSDARERNIRIHCVPLGGARLEQDLHVLGVPQQPYLVAGEKGGLRVQVLHTNASGEERVLHVTHEGVTQSYPLAFSDDPYVVVDLPIQHPRPGSYEYQLSVESLEHEIELRNNHHTVVMDVIPERFRVLLVEGQPFWDSKFIAQTLRKDGRLELMQVSQISEGRQEMLVTRIPESQQTFPKTAEELAVFDLVILGRHAEKVTGQNWLTLLPDYVSKQGGSVIFARARGYDLDSVSDANLRIALRTLEPVDLEEDWVEEVPFFPRISESGHPIFQVARDGNQQTRFEELPAMMHGQVSVPGPGSQVLAEFLETDSGKKHPAMVSQKIGAGQTLMILGDGLWRWRMPGPHAENDRNFYERFWGNLVRWMLSSGDFRPGAELNLELSSRYVRLGNSLDVTLRSRLPLGSRFPERIEMKAPDGTVVSRPLNLLTKDSVQSSFNWTPQQSGVYLEPVPERRFSE